MFKSLSVSLSLADLDDSIDGTQNAMFLLQQRMTALEEMNTLLLERIDELEMDVDQELENLEESIKVTNKIVENHEGDIQGIGFNFHSISDTFDQTWYFGENVKIHFDLLVVISEFNKSSWNSEDLTGNCLKKISL